MHRYSEFVCGECFSDEGVQEFCARHAESTECNFCGAAADEPIAAPVDEVIDHIRSCICTLYDDPANCLGYCGAEGGYQGETYSTDDVFSALELDFPKDKHDRLRNLVAGGLDNDLWCDTDPYGMTSAEHLLLSWENFCHVIKHEKRYFFLQNEERKSHFHHDEVLAPAAVLGAIFSFAETEGAYATLPTGSLIYRARRQPKGKAYNTAGQLGPPPLEHAIQTNRMSPPGVVMTYAADDVGTALAETADKPGMFAVGTFMTERNALLLDLTRLPRPPSVFAELPDTMEVDPRLPLIFLNNIRWDISKPIARDDRVHIEYVPTQVVTEYVRTVVQIGGQKVDGIRYRSSRRNAGNALVFFADQSHLILDEFERPSFYRREGRWLRLTHVKKRRVTGNEIDHWANTPRVLAAR